MQIKDPRHKEILERQYANVPVFRTFKTELRWKWGLPFPYLVLLEDELHIVAVKQGAPKVYSTIKYSDLQYANAKPQSITLVTADNEIVVPIVEASDQEIEEAAKWLSTK